MLARTIGVAGGIVAAVVVAGAILAAAACRVIRQLAPGGNVTSCDAT